MFADQLIERGNVLAPSDPVFPVALDMFRFFEVAVENDVIGQAAIIAPYPVVEMLLQVWLIRPQYPGHVAAIRNIDAEADVPAVRGFQVGQVTIRHGVVVPPVGDGLD